MSDRYALLVKGWSYGMSLSETENIMDALVDHLRNKLEQIWYWSPGTATS